MGGQSFCATQQQPPECIAKGQAHVMSCHRLTGVPLGMYQQRMEFMGQASSLPQLLKLTTGDALDLRAQRRQSAAQAVQSLAHKGVLWVVPGPKSTAG